MDFAAPPSPSPGPTAFFLAAAPTPTPSLPAALPRDSEPAPAPASASVVFPAVPELVPLVHPAAVSFRPDMNDGFRLAKDRRRAAPLPKSLLDGGRVGGWVGGWVGGGYFFLLKEENDFSIAEVSDKRRGRGRGRGTGKCGRRKKESQTEEGEKKEMGEN